MFIHKTCLTMNGLFESWLCVLSLTYLLRSQSLLTWFSPPLILQPFCLPSSFVSTVKKCQGNRGKDANHCLLSFHQDFLSHIWFFVLSCLISYFPDSKNHQFHSCNHQTLEIMLTCVEFTVPLKCTADCEDLDDVLECLSLAFLTLVPF